MTNSEKYAEWLRERARKRREEQEKHPECAFHEAYQRGYEDGILAERNRIIRVVERVFRG